MNTGLDTDLDSDDLVVALDKQEEKRRRQQIRVKAMDFLARREYSCQELQQRLLRRDYGYEPEMVGLIVAELVAEGLLSDERFIESFVASRQRRGQGPVRIRAELRDRGVSEVLIETWLDMRDPQWLCRLRELHDKRFAGQDPETMSERARQQRFFSYRGFTAEQIKHLFKQDADDYLE